MATDIELTGRKAPGYDEILTPEALAFVAGLQRAFNRRRLELLERREGVKRQLDGGKLPDFLPETRQIRESDWTVAPIRPDLL
ncbi:MAG TPA: malate synthase A, partial [Thermoanaerobaculia bacterium]|nr:malate synthase A [Thermoanaerobaculia bacterium]